MSLPEVIMNQELVKLCVSFVCGDRGVRTQNITVELALRQRTDKINEAILKKSESIIMYNNAKEAELRCADVGIIAEHLRQNWVQAQHMLWYLIVSKKNLV